MLQRILTVVPALLMLALTADAQDGKQKFPRMHVALHELREARKELKDAPHDFGGHRAKAQKGVEAAITQIDAALIAAGDDTKGIHQRSPGAAKRYPNYPAMNLCLVALRDAQEDVREAKTDFGGRRAEILHDVHFAITQLELAIKHAKK